MKSAILGEGVVSQNIVETVVLGRGGRGGRGGADWTKQGYLNQNIGETSILIRISEQNNDYLGLIAQWNYHYTGGGGILYQRPYSELLSTIQASDSAKESLLYFIKWYKTNLIDGCVCVFFFLGGGG